MADGYPYKTLFFGWLVQDSALSVGGASGPMEVDDPFCRDGSGRPTLRGTGQAGALAATARKLGHVLSPRISAPARSAENRARDHFGESLWSVWTSHPEGWGQVLTDGAARPGVGIRQDSGAAAPGVLFDFETLPRGSRWWFLLEVDTWRDQDANAEAIAAQSLLEWTRGRCWLGRSVARGLGWMRLDGLRAVRLDRSDLDLWPDSALGSLSEVRQAVERLAVGREKNPRELARAIATPDAPWHYVDVSARLEVGPRISEGAGYGIDTLSIGGHSLATESTEFDEIHYLKPGGKAGVHARDGFTPDFALALTRPIELHEQTFELTLGAAEPFIPGASLRGPLRHTSSRLRRRENAPIVDPITGDTYIETPDPATVDDVSALFGTSNAAKVNRASAALLVRDGYLVDKHWLAAWFQHHAEDEFTGGVYGDSKFDRTALVTGTFEIRMVIEARSRKDADRHLALLRRALALAERGHVAVGGGEWRGRGWIAWTQVQFKRFTAGSDEAEKADPSSADPPTASERAA